MTDTSALGIGSIVEIDGTLFKKHSLGDLWVELSPAGLPRRLPSVWGNEVEVVREAETNVLDGFRVGSVVVYDYGNVAKHVRPGFWEVVGEHGEFSSEELLSQIKDPRYIKFLTTIDSLG